MLRPDIETATSWAISIDGAVAAWIEGSVARSDADDVSDLDLHVAVADGRWSSVIAERHRILGNLSEIITFREAGGDRAWIMSAVLRGPWWVDLTLELATRTDDGLRTEVPIVLFDRAGCAPSRIDADAPERARREHLSELESSAAWLIAHGARVGRAEDAVLTSEYAQRVVWTVIAPALLLTQGVLPRPHGDHARRLSTAHRNEVESLLEHRPEPANTVPILDAAQAALESALGRESQVVRRARTITTPPRK